MAAQTIGINVVLNTAVTQPIVDDLSTHGKVRDVVTEINAITLQAKASELPAIQALPYVLAANPDQERDTGPEQTTAVNSYLTGLSTWDLDAINVTEKNVGRTVTQTGAGVYVAILDTGLVSNWPYYFGTERIAVQYARSFGGGGGDMGTVSQQPNKWGLDQNSHGTHVASTRLQPVRHDHQRRSAGCDRDSGEGVEPERPGMVVGDRTRHRVRCRPEDHA